MLFRHVDVALFHYVLLVSLIVTEKNTTVFLLIHRPSVVLPCSK